MKDILEKASRIRLVVFDVDGVLTDGSLYIGDDGQEYKAFHSRDGHGIKMLLGHGVEIAVITGRTSRVVEHRMKNLGISHVYQGKLEKLPAFRDLLQKLDIAEEQTAYVGDDVVDLPVMRRVGLAIAVQDAQTRRLPRPEVPTCSWTIWTSRSLERTATCTTVFRQPAWIISPTMTIPT
jgi:3-deoxy-D-manno-octulosonate 8-phosphate phosphatase (KDO 8-P phosphatase)